MANISPLCLRVLYGFESTGAPTPHLHPQVAAPKVKEVTPARVVLPMFTSFDAGIRKRLVKVATNGGLFAERSRC
jgi:hypothetical protein